LKERMATSVKEVQKLSAQAQKAVGDAGGPFDEKSRRGRKRGSWSQPEKTGSSLSPGFDKQK
jgi:hypothetical protein